MTYARALHGLDQNTQAVAVLQNTAIQNPNDMEVLGAYGKALADAGRLAEAADILSRAHTPERPNWSVVSTQGTIADELGDHDAAREYYREALKIHPNDPTVLSNMGLSYALSRQLPRAEETLLLAAERSRAPICACAKTSRWCWRWRANSRKRRNGRAAISRRSTPPPMSPRSVR